MKGVARSTAGHPVSAFFTASSALPPPRTPKSRLEIRRYSTMTRLMTRVRIFRVETRVVSS